MYDVIIIGAGAAGMMAAGTAAQNGKKVLVIEKMEKAGRKIRITGKGRCNLTNARPPEEFAEQVRTNADFFATAFAEFNNRATIRFFERRGLKLDFERGDRVFPHSGKAWDVANTLEEWCRDNGVEFWFHTRVTGLMTLGGKIFGVRYMNRRGFERKEEAARVIVATGGVSYPATGSTGSGYAMAQALGHTIIEPTGSLVPLVEKGHDCAKMQGLALKNIAVKLVNTKGKTVYEDFGELLFTHFGLSGPVILSASAHMARGEAGYTVRIDLKPALDEKTLDARILRDFSAAQNRDFENSLSALLPRSMIPVVIARSGIDPMQKVNSITKQQRRALLETIKCFSVPIACKAPVEDAIVTSGGVKVSEVNAKTMESKLVQGLYFAGELLDVDAYTGGFNLQIAWATGRLAGLSAAAKEFQKPEDAT